MQRDFEIVLLEFPTMGFARNDMRRFQQGTAHSREYECIEIIQRVGLVLGRSPRATDRRIVFS